MEVLSHANLAFFRDHSSDSSEDTDFVSQKFASPGLD